MSEAPPRAEPSEGSTEQVRREKLARLRAEGIDPFPAKGFHDRDKISAILAAHDPGQLGEGEHSQWTYRIAGRVVGQRGHGKTIFFDVRDLTGSIQAYARKDSLGEEAFERIEELDIGDSVGIEGYLYVTKRGQLAIGVRECRMLAKALRDPPDLFHGISDPEVRYRHRELDLMANERSREIFLMRAKLVAAIRTYMNEHDFVEMETPMLQSMTGGAAARPFVTHHNTLNRDLFLRPATELYLKRCIIGGFENVYELGKFFRNEGISPQHNPEFTMLEWFLSCADIEDVMAFAEGLISTVVEQVLGTTKVERDGQTIDFKAPWKRLTLREAILEETGLDIVSSSRDELAELVPDDVDPKADWAGVVDTIQGKLVEPKLIQPTFLRDLPLDIWPLVKPHPEHPELLGEAFDGIVAGMEITGGGTDINDPVEQRRRFVEQRERQESGAEENPHEHDEEFVRALEYGMLTASGCGLGVDRLMMILSDSKTLRDVIMFPSMREKPS
ncbi:MAG TPA: lysine--tRNA ligase, partial [Solirubrobacterales bacterium]|nr:lysine--tRNA ligase [Solirubrobacterales bacterium]